MMKEVKIYKYATIGLLILNLALLGFFLFSKPKPPHHPGAFKKKAVKILNLNGQQEANFEELAKEHHELMRSLSKEQGDLLLPYFSTLVNNDEPSKEDLNLDAFQKIEGEKINVTYKHLVDVKNILTEDQFPNYQEFVNSFIDRVLIGKKRRPRSTDSE